MPISLTESDRISIKEIANTITTDQSEADITYQSLIQGFENYASERLIIGPDVLDNQISTELERTTFFKKFSTRLLANLEYAGKSSATVFLESRQHIYNTFRRLGIPDKDRDEMTDAAIFKFWKTGHAEKYNPLEASWRHHVYLSLSRMAATYYEKRSRDLLAKGFAFQQFENSNVNDENYQIEPYEVEQDLSPDQRLMIGEALKDFEDFLKKQRPYREGKEGSSYKEICNIAPPGTKEFPLQEKITVYLVKKSEKSCRVELMDGRRPLFPRSLVQDIKANPDRKKSIKSTVRTPYILYRLLMDTGSQIEQVSKLLRIAPATSFNWVRGLEEFFKQWWISSNHIHMNAKWKARPVRICPGCGEAHLELPPRIVREGIRVLLDNKEYFCAPGNQSKNESVTIESLEGHWCDECHEFTIEHLEPRIDLPYPWGYVRSTQDLQERSSKGKGHLKVQVCSI